MKPFEEYFRKPKQFHQDLFKEVGGADGYRNHPMIAEFYFAHVTHKVGKRIEKFLKTRGSSTRTEMYRRLKLERVGMGPVEAALNKLYMAGRVYPLRGSNPTGRTSTLLIWAERPPSAEMSAILEEFDASPAGKAFASYAPPLVVGGGGEIEIPNISLDKPIDVCEDQQVAEFRKTELANEPKPVSEPKAQKIQRSALLEGLSS